MNVEEELSRSIIDLLLAEPYYAHFMSSVIRVVTTEIPTMAVALSGSTPQLLINEEFFLRELKSASQRVAVLKHEILHLVFKHLVRMDWKQHNHRVANIAMDLVVNQWIGTKWKLPDSAVTLDKFPDLNLPENETFEYYYERLTSLKKEMEKSGWSDTGEGQSADWQASPKDSGKKSGKGGNGKSKGTGKEPDFSKTKAPESAQTLADIIGKPTHSDHRFWGAAQGLDAQLAEEQLDRAIIQARERTPAKSWGSIPGPINELIDAIIQKRKPKIEWRRVLRIFAASSNRTRISHTLKRPSKRYGTRPGIRIRRSSRIAAVIDTSGSVQDSDISMFFAEIHGMHKRGVEITVIECDAEVQREYPYKGQLPAAVAGRGGTVFDPAFAYINKDRKRKYDGCIYLTDGVAEAPTTQPYCRLLWVVTAEGSTGDHLKWGSTIKLE